MQIRLEAERLNIMQKLLSYDSNFLCYLFASCCYFAKDTFFLRVQSLQWTLRIRQMRKTSTWLTQDTLHIAWKVRARPQHSSAQAPKLSLLPQQARKPCTQTQLLNISLTKKLLQSQINNPIQGNPILNTETPKQRVQTTPKPNTPMHVMQLLRLLWLHVGHLKLLKRGLQCGDFAKRSVILA